MNTNFSIRFLLIFALLACYAAKAFSQPFPSWYDDSKYDKEQGVNGRYFLINSNSIPPSEDDKAIIFATNINRTKKDLMRLTSKGVTTFQSPANPIVKLDLYANDGWQGYVLGSGESMSCVGKKIMKIGINAQPDMIKLQTENVHINGNIRTSIQGVNLFMGCSDNHMYGWVGTTSNHNLILGAHDHATMYIDESQNVYIGIVPSAVRQGLKDRFNLFVTKGILTEDLSIAPQASWADYVFDTDYVLRPIDEVKHFIRTNKHLPDVPSAEKIKEEGYSQHDMNKVLLQKIEELTLYMIRQNEQIDRQNKKIRELEAQLR